MNKYTILVTNDDGIESPGLRAAVESVIDIGTVIVAAPSGQQTATGRGLTGEKQSVLEAVAYRVGAVDVQAYRCDCSPALIVKHSMRTLFKEIKPDLLISGINYGENLGVNITSSGTVGAALEAASFGIPGIAISKQTDIELHYSYCEQDWTACAYFLSKFSRKLLEKSLPEDVDVLKIDIPIAATSRTGWRMTTLGRAGYYFKELEDTDNGGMVGAGKTVVRVDLRHLPSKTDIYTLAIDGLVSVTPLSLDLTSRVDLSDLRSLLEE